MPWYAAHIVQYARFLDGNQDQYPLYENVMLVEGTDFDDAFAKAQQIGQQIYDDGGDTSEELTVGGRPATWVFAGIRKLIQCQYYLFDRELDDDSEPHHGTEITYSFLEIASADEFKKYVAGDAAVVTYDE